MPSLNRRREVDVRASRLESEIRSPEQVRAVALVNSRKGLPQCSLCGKTFEEYSRYCPRCDKPTMGRIKPIPQDLRQQAKAGALRRAQAITGVLPIRIPTKGAIT